MFLPAGLVDVLEKMLPQGGQSNLRHQQSNPLPRDPEEVPELGLRLIQLWRYQRELGITEPLQRLGLKSLITRRMLPTQHGRTQDRLGLEMGGSHRHPYDSLHRL